MSFEYNGVVYRDLEPQVRYDAEQIQVLKQADATINENLQTVNTEINGKLTKPANPSAESAVTMLADGTVGTKPLSEIGGGKTYMHKITLYIDVGQIDFSIIKATIDSITLSDFYRYTNRIGYDGYITSTVGDGFIRGITNQSGETTFTINVKGILVDRANDLIALSSTTYNINNFEDFVIEL